jgi:hypothetical protein
MFSVFVTGNGISSNNGGGNVDLLMAVIIAE